MIILTHAEENYLKAIYHLSDGGKRGVSTNDVSAKMKTKPASVTDMLQKLGEKQIIEYRKYHGVHLPEEGKRLALQIIRRHRLWEVFLVEHLKFSWDEINEVSDELSHVRNNVLIQRLDEFLGFPKFDPHGDPIPDEYGDVRTRPRVPINELDLGSTGQIVAVNDRSPAFLKYLDKVGAYIGARIKVVDKTEFDGSVEILVDNKKSIFMSKDVAGNILVMV